jgi:hypothetical protein
VCVIGLETLKRKKEKGRRKQEREALSLSLSLSLTHTHTQVKGESTLNSERETYTEERERDSYTLIHTHTHSTERETYTQERHTLIHTHTHSYLYGVHHKEFVINFGRASARWQASCGKAPLPPSLPPSSVASFAWACSILFTTTSSASAPAISLLVENALCMQPCPCI